MAYNLNFAYNSSTNSYKVTGATGTGTSIVIPSTYNGPQGILPVTIIDTNAFLYFFSLTSVTIPDTIIEIRQNAFFQTSISTIYIPKNVSLIEQNVFSNCNFLTSITVDIDNETYSSDSDILYNKEQTTLLFYPPAKNGDSFTVPNQVETIYFNAMRYALYLTTVNISQNVISADNFSFPYISLQTINVDSQNPNYSSESGVFYNKNKTSLLFYPPAKQDTSFNVPNTVTSISNFGFGNLSILQNIIFSNNLTSIGVLFCDAATSLQKIFFLGNAPSLGVVPFNNTNANLKIYRYSTKSGWSSTFGGKDVLLIDTPSKGLRTFGFSGISSGKVSIKKQNLGGGKLIAKVFSPKDLIDLQLWLKADAGVTTSTITPTYISQIVISGAGESTSNGTYTRSAGGNTSFFSGDNEIYTSDGIEWYLYDNDYGDITYANFDSLDPNFWQEYNAIDAPSAVNTTSTGTPYTGVTSWADQSGNSRNFTKSVNNTGYPTLSNGIPLFTSSATYGDPNASILALPSASLNFTTPYTLIALVRAGANNSCVFSKSNNNAKRRKYQISVNSGVIFSLESINNADTQMIYNTGTGNDVNVKRLIVSRYSSNTSGLLRYNGSLVATSSTNVGIDQTNNASIFIGASPFVEGTGYNAEASSEMYVYEILFYNRALSTVEIEKIETYLNNKYPIICGFRNIDKLAEISGNNAPIGADFNNIAFDYASFVNSCSSLGLDPTTILNSLGGVDFNYNYVVIRAKTSSTINSDSISDLGGGIINITSTGPSGGVTNNYYRFFVMCREGWRTVRFYGVDYNI